MNNNEKRVEDQIDIHSNNDDKKSKTIKILIIIIVLLIILICFGFCGRNRLSNNGETTTSVENTTVWSPDIDADAAAFEDNQDTNGTAAVTGQIKIKGHPNYNIPANQSEKIYVGLENPEENAYYLVFSIVLDDTGETLYTSKMVPPGSAINYINLTRGLPEGQYNVTINVSSYALKTGEPKNDIDLKSIFTAK